MDVPQFQDGKLLQQARAARQCGEKIQYPDRTSAKRARIRLIGLGWDRMSVYRCPFCRFYHLGHEQVVPA